MNRMELTETGLKTILQEQREEYQRYLGVLSGNFTSQVKLVAEALVGVQQQLTSVKEMVAKNTEDIEVMKVETLAMKVDMTAMRRDVEVMKGDISIIKQGLKQKVDQEEFMLLEKRVAALEAKRNRPE